jgi:hypothetical protein
MARRCFALNGMPILGAALIVSTAYAAADDHANGQIHGVVSQAAVCSDGNNIAGNSRSGCLRFSEVDLIDGSGTVDRLANLDAFTGPPTGQGNGSLPASFWSYFALQLSYKC